MRNRIWSVKRGLVFPLLAAVLLLWAGWAPADSGRPVRLGLALAKTGSGVEENSLNFRIAQMAAHDINAHGGVLGRPLELIDIDTQSTALGAHQAAFQLAKAGVAAVVGPSWSFQAMIMGPVLQKAGIPMVGTTTTAPGVTEAGDFIFRVCATDTFQAEVLARFALDGLGASRAVVLTVAGDVYSEGLSTGFQKEFEARGGTVVTQLRYLRDATDFSAEIRVIALAKADLIFVPGYTRDAGLLLRQARSQGLGMPFLGGDGWSTLERYPFLDPAQGDNYYVAHWHPDCAAEASRNFVRLLQQEFGPGALSLIDTSLANTFDAVMLVADAIRRAGSDRPAAIRDALAATENFPGATGLISFRGSRDPRKPLAVLRLTPQGRSLVKMMEPLP